MIEKTLVERFEYGLDITKKYLVLLENNSFTENDLDHFNDTFDSILMDLDVGDLSLLKEHTNLLEEFEETLSLFIQLMNLEIEGSKKHLNYLSKFQEANKLYSKVYK